VSGGGLLTHLWRACDPPVAGSCPVGSCPGGLVAGGLLSYTPYWILRGVVVLLVLFLRLGDYRLGLLTNGL